MRHSLRMLLLGCLFAGCGNVAAAKEELRESIKEAKAEAETEVTEKAVTNAAGRAYLAKLADTADTACKCTSEECGQSVMQSWTMRLMLPSSSDYTLSDVDRTREDSLLQRLFGCASTSDPKTRANIAHAKQDAQVARAKVAALLDDPYEGETAASRVAIHALRANVRAICACTTSACIEPLQAQLAEPPVVTTKRELEVVAKLMAAVPTCAISVATVELVDGALKRD